MKIFLFTIILVNCSIIVYAQTNALWFQHAVPPTNSLTAPHLCDFIESESAKLDPSGRGLDILYPAGDGLYGNSEFRLPPVPWTFHNMFTVMGCRYSGPSFLKVFSTVGVIPEVEYRYVYTAIHGHCIDMHNGTPITNFCIMGDFLLPPLLAIQTNGYFVCGIQQKLLFSRYSATTFAEHNIDDLKQVLTFAAPGYIPFVITNEIYRPIDYAEPYIYSVRLTRANEGEQSVAPYVAQGAPSGER
jgi:hypothetical protein